MKLHHIVILFIGYLVLSFLLSPLLYGRGYVLLPALFLTVITVIFVGKNEQIRQLEKQNQRIQALEERLNRMSAVSEDEAAE